MNAGAAHKAVLQEQVIDLLDPSGRKVLVDCTVGLGGHAEALLDAAGPEATLIGLDLDEENLLKARERLSRFGPRVRLFHANHRDLDEVLAAADLAEVDAILADLGVSSNQLDDPERGLSFQVDGPVDMRLDRQVGRKAADAIGELSEAELADVIYAYGEERYSRRIARAIVTARKRGAIDGTAALAEIVRRAVPAPARKTRRGVHPATRTFQALRIYVNDLLGALEELLEKIPNCLAIGGRAAVISFHSLEDRRVKHAFADWTAAGRAKLLNKKIIQPTAEEIADNPRSRSAKLRGIQRVA